MISTARLLVIEYKCPHFDGFPLRSIGRASFILERRMRRQPSSVLLRVIAFDQEDLFRRLIREVIPPVPWVELDAECLADALRSDKTHGHEIGLAIEEAPVGNGERVMVHFVMDGAPDVDNADATSEKAVSVLGDVVVYTPHACVICLIDMHEFLSNKVFQTSSVEGNTQTTGELTVGVRLSCCPQACPQRQKSQLNRCV